MASLSLRFRVLLLVCLSATLATLAGCQKSPPTLSKEAGTTAETKSPESAGRSSISGSFGGAGTTAEVGLPESDPPFLSKGLADRIKAGMTQEEVVRILQDAAKDSPSAKSSLENVVTLSKSNNIRFDLTVSQGKRKLVLAFRDAKLAEKKQEGLE